LISLRSDVSDGVVPAADRRTGDDGGDGGDSLMSNEFGRITGDVMTSSNRLILIIGSVGYLDVCSFDVDEFGSITRKII